jgi:hypothetical protein
MYATTLMKGSPMSTNSHQRENPAGLLVAQKGQHTVGLLVEAVPGKPVESVEPVLMSLMTTVLARLP